MISAGLKAVALTLLLGFRTNASPNTPTASACRQIAKALGEAVSFPDDTDYSKLSTINWYMRHTLASLTHTGPSCHPCYLCSVVANHLRLFQVSDGMGSTCLHCFTLQCQRGVQSGKNCCCPESQICYPVRRPFGQSRLCQY